MKPGLGTAKWNGTGNGFMDEALDVRFYTNNGVALFLSPAQPVNRMKSISFRFYTGTGSPVSSAANAYVDHDGNLKLLHPFVLF
jgi:hypothetical protein